MSYESESEGKTEISMGRGVLRGMGLMLYLGLGWIGGQLASKLSGEVFMYTGICFGAVKMTTVTESRKFFYSICSDRWEQDSSTLHCWACRKCKNRGKWHCRSQRPSIISDRIQRRSTFI